MKRLLDLDFAVLADKVVFVIAVIVGGLILAGMIQ